MYCPLFPVSFFDVNFLYTFVSDNRYLCSAFKQLETKRPRLASTHVTIQVGVVAAVLTAELFLIWF